VAVVPPIKTAEERQAEMEQARAEAIERQQAAVFFQQSQPQQPPSQ
jgi:hypothetical protein